MKRSLYGGFADSIAYRKVIFYRKEVKNNELLNRNVYYFVRISIVKNFYRKRCMVVTATG